VRIQQALRKCVANRFGNAIPFCNAITHENQQLPICCKTDRLRNELNDVLYGVPRVTSRQLNRNVIEMAARDMSAG
jgi:hypothetical protein